MPGSQASTICRNVIGNPADGQWPAVDQYHDRLRARGLHGLHQLELAAREVQRGRDEASPVIFAVSPTAMTATSACDASRTASAMPLESSPSAVAALRVDHPRRTAQLRNLGLDARQ